MMNRAHLLHPACVLLLASHLSCNPGQGQDMDQADMGGAAKGGEITGTAATTYVSDKGETTREEDLSNVILDVRVPGPDGKTFTTYSVSKGPDGVFDAQDIPQGTYYLHYRESYVVTSARRIDLGAAVHGRPDRVPVRQETPLVWNVLGLSLWKSTDSLFVAATNVGAYHRFSEFFALNPPMAGASRLTDYAIDWRSVPGVSSTFLLSSSRGDALDLVQLVGRAAGGLTYQAAGKVFRAPSFSMTDGNQHLIPQGTFMDLPQDRNMALSWRRSQFEALRTQVNPKAELYTQTLQIHTYPGGKTHGNYAVGINLLHVLNDSKTTDVDLGTVTYGSPAPAEWDLVLSAGSYYRVPYQVSGADPAYGFGFIYHLIDAKGRAAAEMAPVLGPPREPRVGDKDAFKTQNLVGLTPTISWSPPALGQPNQYQVLIYHLFNSNGRTASALVVSFYTSGTSITVPRGHLDEGKIYRAAIVSIMRPGVDPSASPFRKTVPESGATLLTATFTP